MIFCFSGTGNSRYIAKRIAGATSEEILDLNQKIKTQDVSPLRTGQNVIVVVPTYAWRIPRMVSEWLVQTELTDAERIWFVMDCGDGIGNAAEYNRRLAEQKHLHYMGTAQIVMPENYIAMFRVPTVDEAKRIVQKAEPSVEEVLTQIRAEQAFAAPKRKCGDRFLSGLVNRVFYRFCIRSSAFYGKDTCIGCGLCVEKCSRNNVRLKDGKPVWGKECTHCMACICYCPTEAIEYGKKSEGKPRYYFEKLK